LQDKNRLELPPRLEIAAFLTLAIAALLLRINNLSADPPVDLTTSQDVYTDPAQYTSYARNYILYGSFNPLHDYRLVFFLKSATTLLALLIFKIIGVGYFQSNVVGLLFSFATILLSYFSVRKIAGKVAALFFLILISVDYNQIFYGRLPFLENSMNFFGVLAFAVILYGRSKGAFMTAGMFLATAIFFCKLIGLIYLFPFACYIAYDYLSVNKSPKFQFMGRYAFFAAGFMAVALFWYFFSYLPLSKSVSGYVEEQAFDLYGVPLALKSVWIFIQRYPSLGGSGDLFGRMPAASMLAWGMTLIFFYRGFRMENWRNMLYGITPGVLFFIALIVAAYGGLMIWNYRPLRYQTILIYPVYALAGIALSWLLNGDKIKAREHWSFPFFLFALILIPLFNVMWPFFKLTESSFQTTSLPMIFLGVGLIMTIIILLIKKYLYGSVLIFTAPAKKGLVIIAVALTLALGAYRYWDWSGRATYSIVANSKDLAKVLSPEAVVSGPYAAALTIENRLQNLIQMFGVASVDTAFFRKYPITHLIMDRSNEEQAKKNYPQIMKEAVLLSHYYTGGRKVLLYRVAGLTGNLAANEYKPSGLELAMDYYLKQKSDSGHFYMKRFQLRNPDNLTANYVSGVMAFNFQFYDDAEYFLKKSVAFSPTDFHLRYKLGELYIRLADIREDEKYRRMAETEFDAARKYNPSSVLLKENVASLMSRKEAPDLE
jgi:tetratricopeptide (TPR) repeat protein